jgi:hypothetical protein
MLLKFSFYIDLNAIPAVLLEAEERLWLIPGALTAL